jgi:septal ring-binding cell division protein DamX
MNYHARAKGLDRFMKRALLILSTTLSCLGLAGCSWMSKDPCSGDDADLSNPACVLQSKQAYRDNETRWFCIGHLEAKDWSCASSLEEAQNKHDAISKGIAQLSRIPSQIDEPGNAFDFEPAEARRVALLNAVPAQGAHAANDKGRLVAAASKESAPEPTVFAEILPEEIDQRPVDGHFESAHAVAKEPATSNEKQPLNNVIVHGALDLSPGATRFTTELSNPSGVVLETQSLAATVDAEIGALPEATKTAADKSGILAPIVASAEPAAVEVIKAVSTLMEPPQAALSAAIEAPQVDIEIATSELALASVKTVSAPTFLEATVAPASIEAAQAILADYQLKNTVATAPVEMLERASALAANVNKPSVMEVTTAHNEAPAAVTEAPTAVDEVPADVDAVLLAVDEEPTAVNAVLAAVTEVPTAVDEVSIPFVVSAVETPAIESGAAALELVVTAFAPAVEPASPTILTVPAIAENAQPILANTQVEASKTTIEGLAAQSVIATDLANVATIATEIVIPATAPFPAGTTLAEVYADHVNRSEQLPITLQTLGPKGAVPMPAVASAAPDRRIGTQPRPVQLDRATKRPKTQITRLTQAAPLADAVASASKLDSVSASSSGLDYASMDSPATSGDGTYDYFMDLPSDDFAIQLKAEKNLAAIRTFATTVNLEDPLVLKTQLMKRPLYVLVLDTFNDIQLASDAKQAWMLQYDNGIEPWIRTVGSLQKAIQPIGPMD